MSKSKTPPADPIAEIESAILAYEKMFSGLATTVQGIAAAIPQTLTVDQVARLSRAVARAHDAQHRYHRDVRAGNRPFGVIEDRLNAVMRLAQAASKGSSVIALSLLPNAKVSLAPHGGGCHLCPPSDLPADHPVRVALDPVGYPLDPHFNYQGEFIILSNSQYSPSDGTFKTDEVIERTRFHLQRQRMLAEQAKRRRETLVAMIRNEATNHIAAIERDLADLRQQLEREHYPDARRPLEQRIKELEERLVDATYRRDYAEQIQADADRLAGITEQR